VFEAARNLACTGAAPLAITNCLNFPNPEKGSTGWRLSEVIGGMSEACTALGIPVVSGNVSLYNESATRAIHPTPIVGMVGLVDDAATVGMAFAQDGDVIILVGRPAGRLDGSEWLGEARGAPERPDISTETATIAAILRATRLGSVRGAHDISGGGLAVALAESAIAGGIGAHVEIDGDRRPDEALFGEGGGRALLTCRPRDARDVLDAIEANGTTATVIGVVTGDRLDVRVGETQVTLPLAAADEAWSTGLARAWAP
jgi:phosphoribosylformylglycinamidine synthase subunit PurL